VTLGNWASQIFVIVTNYLTQTIYRRKDVFWLTVSVTEASVHGQLTQLFLGCGEAEHPGGRA
jgi:hypothetical protein